MTNPTNCPRCNAALPAGTEPADCPRCLLAAGLESGAPGEAEGGSGAAAAAATAPSPEEIGRHFPQLDVLELLGQGGMGIVYKARQRTLDRMVALKVMPPEVAREPGFAERFTREARTLARLQHPNIVGVHDFGEADGLYYLLMEYVDGANLRQVMREGRLSPSEALAIVPQVCDALQYAHEQGVVHRDVKPENILIDRAGRVRIADFGLAKIVQRTPVDVTLTRAGQVMGTLHYMAPEQYRTPDSVDHRADIYSLGVVFYEMLTGELPLGSFPPPSSRAGVDARLDGVVLRALERERDRRWQSVSEVKTQVSAATTEPAAAAAPAPAAPPLVALPSPPPKLPAPMSRLATLGGLGMPIAIAAGVAAWLALTLMGLSDLTAASTGWSVAGVAALLGWIVSVVAWVRIRHSGGTLSGQGWAVTGTLLPLAFLCCGFPFSCMFVSPATLRVEEGPDGTRVRMPFLEVEESPDETRVRMPGLEVTEERRPEGPPDYLSFEVHGGELARVPAVDLSGPPDEADRDAADRVTGGPRSLSRDRRAIYVRAAKALWQLGGSEVLAGHEDVVDGRAQAFEFFHLALGEDGSEGRLVLTDGESAVAVDVRISAKSMALGRTGELRRGGATDADRDGELLR